MNLTRRHFLGSSATAVIVAGMKAQGNVIGANNRVRVATVGFNGRGQSHIKGFLAMKDEGVEVAGLCDVDANVLAAGGKLVEKSSGRAPKLYKDVRELCTSKDIDAVTTATPNHWHSLVAILGLQGGKDVYVEKPMSHNVWEGRQVVAAAQKYGKIVQHGTQSRSHPRLIRDMKLIHSGFIGQIVESRGYVYKNGNRGSIGRGAPGPVPTGLDWSIWQGPAQEKPFYVKTLNSGGKKQAGMWVPYDWHYNWEYGNGEIGNQGVHQMDIACWGHNRGLPTKVHSAGGRFGMDDDGMTPNTQATTFSYPDGTIVTFEVRNLGSFQEMDGGDCGNSFFGTKGFYVVGKGFFTYKQGAMNQREAIPVKEPVEEGDGNPFKRFVDAVRSRKQSDAPMSVEDAHVSCVHCHLGNIAYRLGRSLEFDPKTEQFKDKSANHYLTREYRKGFEVPKFA